MPTEWFKKSNGAPHSCALEEVNGKESMFDQLNQHKPCHVWKIFHQLWIEKTSERQSGKKLTVAILLAILLRFPQKWSLSISLRLGEGSKHQ